MLSKISMFVFRIFLLACSLALFYIFIPYKIADIQVKSATDTLNQEHPNTKALYWNPNSSKALTNLAEISKSKNDYSKAKTFALEALRTDPTNGQAMSILVTAYEFSNEEMKAEKALTLAPKLWPSHSYIHITLADYWTRKGNIKNVLEKWDLLIIRHRALYKPIFPVLLSFANTEKTRDLLTPYVSRPAIWWNDFFSYMTENKVSLPILKHFYELRLRNDLPLEKNERAAYVKRLQQDGLSRQAYSVWSNGLNKKQTSLTGLVFDGGFESSTHDTAYDWNFKQTRQAKITLGRTRGITGKRALHIVFNKRKSIKFKHVWQQLLLKPNLTYSVKMKTRIDSLKNPEGLVWKVRCLTDRKQTLGESEALWGRKQWQVMSFEFTIPKNGCETQMIRLEARSKFHHEQFFKGGIWFDQLTIAVLN